MEKNKIKLIFCFIISLLFFFTNNQAFSDETGDGQNILGVSQSITLNNSGVQITGSSDGDVTFQGLGNGFKEAFNINLDDTENTAVITSTTGITKFNYNDISLTIGGGFIYTGNIPFVIGEASTDSITFTTDGTGNAEIVFPDDSIGADEIDGTNLSFTTSSLLSNGFYFRPSATTSGNNYIFQIYDNDDTTYRSITLTNGNTPTFDIGAGIELTGLDPDFLTGDTTDDKKVDQDIIEGFGASASPLITLIDSDAAGADAADENTAFIAAQMTTTTEDGEIGDVRIGSIGGSAAGTMNTNYWFDSSDQKMYLGIMTDADAPAAISNYENLIFDFDTATDNDVNISSGSGVVQISLTGLDVSLPNTTHADESGIIYKGSNRFLSNFNYGNNGSVTTDGYNIFLGELSGNLTIGSGATATYHSSHNICIGYTSGLSLTKGMNNSLLGSYSGRSLTDGFENVYIGNIAGRYITDGATPNTSSDYCVLLGSTTKVLADNDQNEIVIGYNAIGSGSNSVTLGNTSITSTVLRGVIDNTPQALSVTTEANITLRSSIVLITGDDDTDHDTIDLQNGALSGQTVTFIAEAAIDANDTIIMNYADTTCTNCSAVTFDKIGENACYIWTGTTWVLISSQTAL